MPADSQDITVVLDKCCSRHQPLRTETFRIRDEQDWTFDVLVCGDCWRKDKPTLLTLCRALKLGESDIKVVRRNALGK